ncbi:unnamed protein product [Orchesella dallaii]|uniref:RanBD1 domain-containing protein n=1 Tax=Orchesella dallaii TaxID=48710 RepID=A0ABP1QMJ2_9HEXA
MASIVSSVSSSSDSECKEPTEQDSSVSTTSSSDKAAGSEEKLEIKNQEMRNKPNEEDEEEDDDSDGGVNSTQTNDDDDKTLQGVNVCSPMMKGSLVQSRVLIRPSAFKFGSSSASSSTPSFTASTNNFVLRPAKLIPSSPLKAQAVSAATAPVEVSTPQFVPLEKDETSGGEEKVEVPQATQEESNANPNFVFGSNLSERVNIPEGGVVSSGQKRKIPNEDDDEEVVKKPAVEDTVPLGVTGEEHEVNAMQLHCRLFIFDSTNSSWVERGRGLLRLNDSKEETDVSRLIIRSKGSLRVMLNTKVWEGMRVEKTGDKSVRIMAVDLEANSEVDTTEKDQDTTLTNALRIFLIMTTSISEAYALTGALESRVAKAASRTSSSQNDT